MSVFNRLLLLFGLRESVEPTQSIVDQEEAKRKRRGELIDDELNTLGGVYTQDRLKRVLGASTPQTFKGGYGCC